MAEAGETSGRELNHSATFVVLLCSSIQRRILLERRFKVICHRLSRAGYSSKLRRGLAGRNR